MWLFLVLLAVLAWFVMRHLAAERQARELAMAQHRAALALEVRQHRRELATFEHEADGMVWGFDFDGMTLSLASLSPESAEMDYRTFDLKRSDGGVWHYRMPDAAHRQRVEELKRSMADASRADDADAERELEVLGERPAWVAVPEALAAKVESRYERFLRHYKG